MNILLLSGGRGMAGSTNSIAFLAKGLHTRGHTVFVGCPRQSVLGEMLAGTGVVVVAMSFRGMFDRGDMQKIRELVRDHGIQVINAQSHNDRYIAIFARFLFRLPVALVHTRRQPPLSSGGWLQSRFFSLATDAIVAVSATLKDTLVAKGYIAGRVHVIYNGTPAARYRNGDNTRTEALRRKLQLPADAIVIGCISRRKKQDQLIRALPLLPFNVTAIFAGVEPGIYDELIRQTGCTQRVVYAGFIDGDTVLDYYRLCSCSVVCSTTDGFGLSLVESMALDVPVAATRSVGFQDVITHGNNGLLFDDGNIQEIAGAVTTLINDTAVRQRCIANGRITAFDTFSIERTIAAYESLFARLIR